MLQRSNQTLMELTHYLESVSRMSEARRRPDWKYSSIEHFVLENGYPMLPSELPSEFSRMPLGRCYQNAFELAMEDASLVYVEGYACGVLPMMHAWLVRDGSVIDPTWDRSIARAYYGVTFSTEFALEKVCRSKYYGILDDCERDWPLLRGIPKSEWFHEVFEVGQAQQSKP